MTKSLYCANNVALEGYTPAPLFAYQYKIGVAH